MDRRIAIQRIGMLLGAAVSVPTASALLSGCRIPDNAYEPRVLGGELMGSLGELAEVILPQTDTPGALEAGVHRFIDAMLADYYPAAEASAFQYALPDLLSAVQVDGVVEVGAVERLDAETFAAPLPPRSQGDAFSRLQCYRRTKELVVSGYYTSQLSEANELKPMPMGIRRADVPFDEIGRAWA